MTTIHQLVTPALVVDVHALARNAAAMAAARPGSALRPHVKAFKTTALARLLRDDHGHEAFCCATLAEMEGMAAAGLGDDLLLANETLDTARLGALAARDDARVTVAVDSHETIDVARRAGCREVLVDVDVGLPRCGCTPDQAGALAEAARSVGLTVRGVMGYEGHCQDWDDPKRRREAAEESMALLATAHGEVGGSVISAGGTGTHAVNRFATEIQAGSYLLMDTHYARLADLPFEQAMAVLSTVISVRQGGDGWFVLDAGLKALGMDHGDPTVDTGAVFFCSDEHTTVLHQGRPPALGDRVRLWPAHVDPTVAKHPSLHLVDGEQVVGEWPIDLRDW
ncbi:MAG: alanine racemase [Acidimicrobiales bacterium]